MIDVIGTLCREMDIPVLSIERWKRDAVDIFDPDSLKHDGAFYFFEAIAYDDTLSRRAQRYLIAHELGHAVMGHMSDGKLTPEQEQEANLFACVLTAIEMALGVLQGNSEKEKGPLPVGAGNEPGNKAI